MGYFNPDSYSLQHQLADILRYGDVTTTDDGLILKKHSKADGSYSIEVTVPCDNSKNHDSYEFYYDKDGKFIRYQKH